LSSLLVYLNVLNIPENTLRTYLEPKTYLLQVPVSGSGRLRPKLLKFRANPGLRIPGSELSRAAALERGCPWGAFDFFWTNETVTECMQIQSANRCPAGLAKIVKIEAGLY